MLIKTTRTDDIQYLLTEIESHCKKSITTNSLVFFDEIQKQPEMFSFLRYLYEKKPGLKVIAAGSLLEFYIEEMSQDIPVGRIQYLYMGPVTFFEFLNATKQKLLLQHLSSYANGTSKDIHPAYHEKALDQFALYLRVGGMPEAVKVFAQSQSLIQVAQSHWPKNQMD